MNGTPSVTARERDTIMQALAAGVVPRQGLRHIQVGRAAEVAALIGDIDRMSDDGATVRFIIGEYGAGKTFFLNLVRLIALEKKLVTIQADLAPDRRLLGRDGQARGLYAEAVKNMATRTKPDGGALASIMERFLTDAVREAETAGTVGRQGYRRQARPVAGRGRRLRLHRGPEILSQGQRQGRRRPEDRRLSLDPRGILDEDRGPVGPSGPEHHRRHQRLRLD